MINTLDMRQKFTPNEGPEPSGAERGRVAKAEETVDEDGEETIVPAESEEDDTEAPVGPEDGEEGEGEEAEDAEPEGEGDAADAQEPPKPGKRKEPEHDPAVVVSALEKQRRELLEEIAQLRGQRRELKGNPLSQKQEPLMVPRDQVPDELADVDQTSVEIVERVLKARGYVRKDDIEAREHHQSVSSAQEAWMEAHPEYKPENDPNDEKWNRLAAIVGRFKPPANAKEARTILDMAHRELAPTVQKAALPTKTRATVDAGREKLKATSNPVGGGSGKAVKPVAGRGKPDLSHLKGFTEEEKAELFS